MRNPQPLLQSYALPPSFLTVEVAQQVTDRAFILLQYFIDWTPHYPAHDVPSVCITHTIFRAYVHRLFLSLFHPVRCRIPPALHPYISPSHAPNSASLRTLPPSPSNSSRLAPPPLATLSPAARVVAQPLPVPCAVAGAPRSSRSIKCNTLHQQRCVARAVNPAATVASRVTSAAAAAAVLAEFERGYRHSNSTHHLLPLQQQHKRQCSQAHHEPS
jgi:hypothetical protein